MKNHYVISAKLFKWSGEAAWHFLRVNEKISGEIKDNFSMLTRGWGSLPVEVRLGKSVWKTSIFPDKDKTYLLPIKSKIRKVEKIADGDLINLDIKILIDKQSINPPPLNSRE